MVDKKTIVKAAIWSTAGSLSGQLVGFAIFVVLAIFLGPKAYGLMAMAMAIIAVSEILIVGGLTEALVQRERLEQDHIDSVFWLLIGLAVCLAILAQACATPIATAFGEPVVGELIRWLSVLPVLHALSAVPSALLQRRMRFDLLALRSLLGLALGGGAGIGMAVNGLGVWSLVGYQLTQQTAVALVLWLTSKWQPRARCSVRHLRDLLGFGGQIIGLKLVSLGEQQLIRIVIGASFGPAALGLFQMGWRLLDILRISLLVPLASTAMPAFSRMQSNLALVRGAMQSGVRLTALIGFPAFLGLAAVAPDLILSLFGTQWAGGVRVVQVLALLGALWSLANFYGAAMRGLGRPIMQLAPQVLGVAVLIVLLLIFGRYSIEATAWCILIRTLLLLPLTTYLAHRVTGLEIDKQHRACLLPLGSAVAMAAIVVCWRLAMIGTLSSPMTLASSVLVGVVVYCGCIVLLDRNITRQVVDLARTAAARKPVAGADL